MLNLWMNHCLLQWLGYQLLANWEVSTNIIGGAPVEVRFTYDSIFLLHIRVALHFLAGFTF